VGDLDAAHSGPGFGAVSGPVGVIDAVPVHAVVGVGPEPVPQALEEPGGKPVSAQGVVVRQGGGEPRRRHPEGGGSTARSMVRLAASTSTVPQSPPYAQVPRALVDGTRSVLPKRTFFIESLHAVCQVSPHTALRAAATHHGGA